MMKRLLLLLLILLPSSYIIADVTEPLPPTSEPISSSTTSGSDTFGALVQQNTAQAQAIFQGVDYKTLSGNQDQNYFFSSDDNNDTSNLSTLIQKFKLAPGS